MDSPSRAPPDRRVRMLWQRLVEQGHSPLQFHSSLRPEAINMHGGGIARRLVRTPSVYDCGE